MLAVLPLIISRNHVFSAALPVPSLNVCCGVLTVLRCSGWTPTLVCRQQKSRTTAPRRMQQPHLKKKEAFLQFGARVSSQSDFLIVRFPISKLGWQLLFKRHQVQPQ